MVDAAQAAYEQPGTRIAVVMEPVISSDGQVVPTHVAESSGRASFDAAAELTVQRGLQARFQLEETTGKVSPQLRVPLRDVTTTQIEVLSVFPVALEPEAAQ